MIKLLTLELLAGLLLAAGAQAQVYNTNFTGLDLAIPDANPVGLVETGAVTNVPSGWIVSSVTVGLQISGGFNGDLYGYLVAPNGTLVRLLNRPGVGPGDDLGYAGSGLDVTFSDAASGSIQSTSEPSSVVLSGTYQADQSLTGLAGSVADGTWTLFLADLSAGGGVAKLEGWNLAISAVPQPVTVTLARHAGTSDATTYGDSLSFDVLVSGATPTGTVTLYDGGTGGTVLGTGTLSSGVCTISPAANGFSAGLHTNIVAVYGGDSTFASGTSAMLSAQTVALKSLTVAGVIAESKVYDGVNTVTLDMTAVALSGVVSGDSGNVSLNSAGATGSFTDPNAGPSKPVTTSGFSLAGPAAANYGLTQPGLAADITPLPLSVTAPTIASKIYDGTPSAGAVTVGALSGLLGSETVSATAVAADYLGANVGLYNDVNVTYTLHDGSNGGLAANYSLANGSATGQVTPRLLSISAPTIAARAYNGTTTPGVVTVGTLSGFVGTETLTATAAVADYPSANAGSYTVAIVYSLHDGSNGGLAANYSLANGSATGQITQAVPSLGLASSLDPSGYKAPVTFTATLPADATGSLVFSSASGAFSANALNGGSATSLGLSDLPRGADLITAVYAGDLNYSGTTNTLVQTVTNHPPVAAVMTVYQTVGLSLKVSLSDLATNWSDVDGDVLTLAGIGLMSTNGVTITTNGGWIVYSNSVNAADQINYTIGDGQGGTTAGIITILPNAFVTGQPASITVSNGVAHVKFYGIPGYTYQVQRSVDLSSWVNLQTTTVDSTSVIDSTDRFTDLSSAPAEAFYRLAWQP